MPNAKLGFYTKAVHLPLLTMLRVSGISLEQEGILVQLMDRTRQGVENMSSKMGFISTRKQMHVKHINSLYSFLALNV
jgi:hypothetical protein